MKAIMKMTLVALIAMGGTQTANAQLSSLKKAASSVVNKSTATSVVTNVVSNLLGTSKVSETNLVGTWTYSEPCVVLESNNVLSNVGGTVITNKVETQLSNVLKKIGFTAGKVVLTLNEDKSFTMTISGKPAQGSWAVDGTNLVLTVLGKSVKMNAKLNLGQLQLAMSADKMLTLLSSVTSQASTLNSNFGTLSTLLSKYDGLYLGLKFTK